MLDLWDKVFKPSNYTFQFTYKPGNLPSSRGHSSNCLFAICQKLPPFASPGYSVIKVQNTIRIVF